MSQDAQRAKTLRNQGISALKSGDKAGAQELLAQSVEINPHDEHAWLWLSATTDDLAERRFCLEKALAVNPNSEAARKGLVEMKAASVSVPPPAQTSSAGLPTVNLADATRYTPPATLPPTAPIGAAAGPALAPVPSYHYYVPEARVSRPTCIGCLAVFSIFGGLLIFAVALLFSYGMEELQRSGELASLGPMATILQGAVFVGVFLALISVAMGIGLWRGQAWGWWLTTTSWAYSVVQTVLSAILLLRLGGDAAALGGLMFQLVIYGGVYYYLFMPNVWSFFRLHSTSKGMAAAISLSIGFVLNILMLMVAGGLQALAG